MKYKLSEIMDLIGGGTPKTTKPEYWDGDIPWLSVKDFNNDFRFVYETEKHITELGLNNSSTKLLQAGDIIISARGTVGEIATIPFPMAFNQSCYDVMRKRATATIETAEAAVQRLENERAEVIAKSKNNLTWIEQFAKYQSFAKLTREIAVAFIDKVTVFEDKTVHIDFNYRDEIASYQEILKTISQEVG